MNIPEPKAWVRDTVVVARTHNKGEHSILEMPKMVYIPYIVWEERNPGTVDNGVSRWMYYTEDYKYVFYDEDILYIKPRS